MNKRILVIDDDEAIRKSFMLSLQDTEYQLDTADSGEKGIEKAQNARYDLIFLDLKMPGMDGMTTLRELRKIDQDVCIYILTAFHPEFLTPLKSATGEGIKFQALKKPLSCDALMALLESTFAESPGEGANTIYKFKLYLIGGTSAARDCIRKLKQLLAEELPGQFSLETIDLLEEPSVAERDNIFATPTLVKTFPPPTRRITGNIGDGKKLRTWLGLKPRATENP
ncbi:MAG: response regulator [Dehalococcoidia bacterium]|nr:response regulator [Dehalococcoidia bacterium]